MAKVKKHSTSGSSVSKDARTSIAKSNLSIGKDDIEDRSIHDSMRRLSESFRLTALDHFSGLARSVAENPSLETRDRIDALYQGLKEVSKLILALSASLEERSVIKRPLRAKRSADSLQPVSQQLIDYLSVVEGAPVEDLRQLIETVVAARTFGENSARPVTAHTTLRPPVPELTEEQLTAVIVRGKERPWNARQKYHMSSFEWVRDNYGEWIPGLRQSHLKLADGQLYIAFSKTLSRAKGRRPDWLDLPSDNEHHLRVVAFSNPVRVLVDKRQKHRERMRHSRQLR